MLMMLQIVSQIDKREHMTKIKSLTIKYTLYLMITAFWSMLPFLIAGWYFRFFQNVNEITIDLLMGSMVITLVCGVLPIYFRKFLKLNRISEILRIYSEVGIYVLIFYFFLFYEQFLAFYTGIIDYFPLVKAFVITIVVLFCVVCLVRFIFRKRVTEPETISWLKIVKHVMSSILFILGNLIAYLFPIIIYGFIVNIDYSELYNFRYVDVIEIIILIILVHFLLPLRLTYRDQSHRIIQKITTYRRIIIVVLLSGLILMVIPMFGEVGQSQDLKSYSTYSLLYTIPALLYFIYRLINERTFSNMLKKKLNN